MKAKKIRVRVSGDESGTAYVSLPGHKAEHGIVSKTIRLDDLIDGFKGPWVNLDFNKDGVLIGIEILCRVATP
jgi:hypothetical protein